MAFGRRDPEHEAHVKHTRKLLDDPGARQKLKRFNLHQRLQHWFLVLMFATLCITGFPMKFADRAWAARVIELLGGLQTARDLHHYAGAALIAGFFYHLGYIAWTIIRNKRRTGDSWWKTVWDLPMMLKPADGLFMINLMLYMVGLRKKHPPAGRFNPEEKFEYIGVFWGTFVLGLTGVLMWANAWTTRSMPGRVLTIASLLHTFEAFLALLHVGIVHIAGVIFSPTVFPVSKAMFTGDTPAEELVEGHSEMVEAVEKQMGAAGSSHG
jgi:formate dehydrogenase gamma subunit